MKLIPLFEMKGNPLTDSEIKEVEKAINSSRKFKNHEELWSPWDTGESRYVYQGEDGKKTNVPKSEIVEFSKNLAKNLPAGITFTLNAAEAEFTFSGSKSAEKPKPKEVPKADNDEYGITSADIKKVEGLSFHDFSGMLDGKKHNYSLEEIKKELGGLYDEDDMPSDDKLEAIRKVINAGVVKWKDEVRHDGEYTGLYQAKNKTWPWQLDTSIDHQPYSILMKVPIEFDTSY